MDKHVAEVGGGRGVFVNKSGALVIEDDITPRLNRIVNSFFIPTRMALYHLCGQKPLEEKVSQISPRDSDRNELRICVCLRLIEVRKSCDMVSGLQEIRDTIIHDTEYDGLKMLYQTEGRRVLIGFPRLNGVPIIDFVEMFWNNIIDFCEEMIMLALSTRMPPTCRNRSNPH